MQLQSGRFRAVQGLGWVFAVVAALVILMQWTAGVLRWIGYRTVVARVDGAIDQAEYQSARDTWAPIEAALWLFSFPAMLVAWALLITWLWRSRANADAFSARTHRLARPWAIWSWVVPVVSLWFPAMFLGDVDRASAVRSRNRALIVVWWSAWILAWVVFWASALDLPDDEATIQTMTDSDIGSLFRYSALRTGATVLFTVAAGCLTATVFRIGRAQSVWAPR
ncbi:DUF4328 domain-containing protein [Nocardia asiatica]|uniref:DUF4328 domain-containing protein n=1 Tax=Nocardia asiatica TaxID=209252 RepID=UPI003EE0DD07